MEEKNIEKSKEFEVVENEVNKKKYIFTNIISISSIFILNIIIIFLCSNILMKYRFAKEKSEIKQFEMITSQIDSALNKYYYDYNNETTKDGKPKKKMSKLLGAIKGYVLSLGDPYTTYYSKEEWEEELAELEGDYTGIGVLIQFKDNLPNIAKVFANSGADDAGIRSGDIIYKVNGTKIEEIEKNDITKHIRGKENTKVKITVLRDKKELEFDVTRKKMKIKHVENKMLTDDIGYISIEQFDLGVHKDFKNAFIDLEQQGMKKLILDLRQNTGGNLAPAEEIADMFLPKGKTIYSAVGKNNKNKKSVTKNDDEINIPFVILIDGYSASASELLAASLIENGKGVTIGSNSFGKGVIQQVLTLPNGDYLKMTIAEYLSPNGNKIQKVGLKPKINVVEENKEIDIKELSKSKVLQRAVQYLEQGK